MKTIFLSIGLFLSVVSFSQTALSGNGGQVAENTFAKLEYMGYQSGNYVLQITNKQGCSASIKVSWLNKDTTFTNIVGNGSVIVNLPGSFQSLTKITGKPQTKCTPGAGDMGNLEITAPASLPIKFKSIKSEKVDNNHVKVYFDVSEVSGVNTYNIQVSTDGVRYVNRAIVFPDNTQPNRVYSVIIQVK